MMKKYWQSNVFSEARIYGLIVHLLKCFTVLLLASFVVSIAFYTSRTYESFRTVFWRLNPPFSALDYQPFLLYPYVTTNAAALSAFSVPSN